MHDLVSENGSAETEGVGDGGRVSLFMAVLVASEPTNCNRLELLPCSEGVGEEDACWRRSTSGGSSPLMVHGFTAASLSNRKRDESVCNGLLCVPDPLTRPTVTWGVRSSSFTGRVASSRSTPRGCFSAEEDSSESPGLA